MVLAAIWPEESFNASWQLLWSNAVGRYPELAGRCPSPASVTKARYRLPLAVWRELFDWTCDKIKILSGPFARWKGHRIVLLDGTCVSMPDTADLFKQFGTNTGYNGKGKYPLARMVTVCLANTMAIIDYTLGCYTESEDSLAFKLFTKLDKGDLLVGDRRFAAAHYYARYRSMGLEFLTRIHQCENVRDQTYLLLWQQRLHRLAQNQSRVFTEGPVAACKTDGAFYSNDLSHSRSSDGCLAGYITARWAEISGM